MDGILVWCLRTHAYGTVLMKFMQSCLEILLSIDKPCGVLVHPISEDIFLNAKDGFRIRATAQENVSVGRSIEALEYANL
jgi:hypothetical protein